MTPRRLDRAAAIGVALLVLAIFLVGSFVGSSGDADKGSVESADEGGRLAAFLLLERLGFEPEIWREAPGLLPSGDHVVWCASVPRSLQDRFAEGAREEPAREPRTESEPGEAEGEDPVEQARRAEPRALPFVLHDLKSYGDFVREGGTLVLPAVETARALTDTLGLVELERLGGLVSDRARLERVIGPGGEELRFDDAVRLLAEPDPESFAEELITTPDGGWFALSVPVGAGRVVLLADSAFLDNPAKQGFLKPKARGLQAADHALLAVRLVEELDRGGRLLFDEYALGRWVPDSAVGLAASGRRGILTLQLVLFLLVLAWRATWVREFPRDPEGLGRLSPLSRARAHAGLFARAGRFDLLGGMLRRGSLRRLCALARLRLPTGGGGRSGGEPEVEPDATSAAWEAWAGERLDELLAAVGDEGERERYARPLLGRLPRTAGELDQLASALAALERQVAARCSGPLGGERSSTVSDRVPDRAPGVVGAPA